jgi:hypothetical protein
MPGQCDICGELELSNDNLMTPEDIGVFVEANKK